MNTPVLLLIFNRPEPTRLAVEALRRVRPARLYVAGDGPRADRPGEADRVRVTREIATTVDWDCEVSTLFRDNNLGCKRAVSGALDWFFSHEPEGIVLEDDIAPTDDFFRFCIELLSRYRDDEHVGIIGGLNPVAAADLTDDSYLFTRYPSIWGWASWARTWHGYQVDMRSWSNEDASRQLTEALNGRRPAIRYWRDNFDAVARGEIDSWAYPFVWHCWRRGLMSILPTTSLCDNIGFGVDATHTTGAKPSHLYDSSRATLTFPLRHPLRPRTCVRFDRRMEDRWYRLARYHRLRRFLAATGRRIGLLPRRA